MLGDNYEQALALIEQYPVLEGHRFLMMMSGVICTVFMYEVPKIFKGIGNWILKLMALKSGQRRDSEPKADGIPASE